MGVLARAAVVRATTPVAPQLQLKTDLAEYGPGFGSEISGIGDWSSHHNMSGASRDGFGWRDHADLVSLATSRGSHTGGHYGELVS